MKEEDINFETSTENENVGENAADSSGSLQDAISFLEAFGSLFEKAGKMADPAKQEPDKSKIPEISIQEISRMVWNSDREDILTKFPEIVHVDIEPTNGYLFAAIKDEMFNKMKITKLKDIKQFCYELARQYDNNNKVTLCNFRMVFDTASNYGKFESSYYYFLSDLVANQVIV